MTFEQPTYEEYKSATAFAKFKYKYGIIVVILCWVCLLFLSYYMFTHGEAISRNPLIYGADKADVECHCYNYKVANAQIEFYVNGSNLWTVNNINIMNP